MTASFSSLPLPSSPRQRRYWSRPHGSALALRLAQAAAAHAGLLVVVTRDMHAASLLESELKLFAGESPVLSFPDWETLPYDV